MDGRVYFATDGPIPFSDLRLKAKSSSKSRRFTFGGQQYKWKPERNNDMICVDLTGKRIASWNATRTRLSVPTSIDNAIFIDRLVVTCLLNLWFRKLDKF